MLITLENPLGQYKTREKLSRAKSTKKTNDGSTIYTFEWWKCDGIVLIKLVIAIKHNNLIAIMEGTELPIYVFTYALEMTQFVFTDLN